ncbi:MAG TPA: hypothetical protein VKU92_12535 [Acidimicrobiales bacterium]|nr:hypothetical protein [Acidimicrobiales bacterium]
MGRCTIRRRVVGLALHGVIVASLVVGGAAPALAATSRGHGGGSGGGRATPTGNDVSYPQCGTSLPAAPAFGIVGLTGGLANDLNPCFGPSSSYPSYDQSELYWAAASSTGGASQPKASLYVNTADPGNVYDGTAISDWPDSGSTPYGSCTTTTVTLTSGTDTVGADSPACAWQYGYDNATEDVSWLEAAASAIDGQAPPVTVAGTASSYPWWLDVETANTWQSDTTMNVADLEGMIAALRAAGATAVGAYSTSSQWDTITGGTSSASGSLYGMPDWIPGARNLSGAQANCGQASFTGGTVTLTQWFSHPDGDYAC